MQITLHSQLQKARLEIAMRQMAAAIGEVLRGASKPMPKYPEATVYLHPGGEIMEGNIIKPGGVTMRHALGTLNPDYYQNLTKDIKNGK